MRRGRIGRVAIAVSVIAALACAGTAQASIIAVTTTGDPGPGGTTSLRQAVAAANDGDTVSVPTGHYTLATGQITVAKAITLAGAGATTIVDGNGASRVFDVTSAGTVTFQHLRITAGAVNVASTNVDGGAGVRDKSGNLAFDGVVLSSNIVLGGGGGAVLQGGGAIFSATGALTVANSTLAGNSVTLTGSSSNNGGGAIYEEGSGVTVTNSTLTGNSFTASGAGTTSNDGGGAIYDNGGGVTLTDSALMGNSASVSGGTSNDGGGAVYDNGAGVTATGSELTGNSASMSSGTTNNGGGAIYENGSGLSLSASSISNNALTIATGTSNDGGGGIYNNGGPFNLSTSTVASNSAKLTATAGFNGGGGIYSNGGVPTFVNVTLGENVLAAPSGSNVGGGGLYQNGSPGTITNATLTANQSNQPGGGVFRDSGLTFKSTIVAANSASSGHANCDGPIASSSAGNNLEDTSPTTCHFTAAGDLVGMPAGLGPLADNGGPAPTHSLLAGSPAIDHIPLAQCTDQQGTPKPVTTDERGVPRGLDGACDVGAYELAPADLALTAAASPSSIALGGQSTLTFSVSNDGPAPATNIALTVVLPAGLTLVSASATQGSCGATASGASCTLGLMASGSSAQATVVVRAAAAGTQTVTATASASEPDPTPADNMRAVAISVIPLLQMPTFTAVPTITAARQSVSRWREGNKLARISRKKRPPVGTTFSFSLNEQASVSFAFTQQVQGRKLGRKCVAQTKKNRHRHACKRTVTAGSLLFSGHTGTNKVAFQGRVSPSKKLRPGRYTLVITATNSTGARSAPVSLTFTIVR